MYKFLWSGKDRHGNQRSTFIHAQNSAAAKESLIAEGWSDLQMLHDEIASAAGQRVDAPEDWRKEVTADALVDTFEGRNPGFSKVWIKGIVEAKGSLILGLALLAWGIYAHRTLPIVSG